MTPNNMLQSSFISWLLWVFHVNWEWISTHLVTQGPWLTLFHLGTAFPNTDGEKNTLFIHILAPPGHSPEVVHLCSVPWPRQVIAPSLNVEKTGTCSAVMGLEGLELAHP